MPTEAEIEAACAGFITRENEIYQADQPWPDGYRSEEQAELRDLMRAALTAAEAVEMSEEDEEAYARAICKADGFDPDAWSSSGHAKFPGAGYPTWHDYRHLARAVLALARRVAGQAVPRWQPIETARKDVTVMLWGGELYDTSSFSGPWPMQEPNTANWYNDKWIVGNADGHDEYIIARNPTHWMPLPAAPKPAAKP